MYYVTRISNILKEEAKPLYYATLFSVILGVISLTSLCVDDRTLMGVNVWLKPLKFSISTGIYTATMGYYSWLYQYKGWKKTLINQTVAWTIGLELLIIVGQGARGVQSHYNISSPMDGILFSLMGIMVGINVLLMGVYLIDTLRRKPMTSGLIQWALLLGWVGMNYGGYVGGQMISQMSHTVGLADGGEGLPFLNWSTIAGDLRMAHFFGIHAIQVLPILAFFLDRKWNISKTNKFIVFTSVAALYLTFMAVAFYNAKQGLAMLPSAI